jgi:hypothetical protein
VKADPTQQRNQLAELRRKVDFDSYDVTVDELIRRVERKRIEVAPIYQRQFRWDPKRQSKLIESLLLGIPVPPLFMATNLEGGQNVQWEVVDGLQRLLTLVNFAGNEAARISAGMQGKALNLIGLEKLTLLEGASWEKLPKDISSALEDRPMKVIVLNDKSDLQVRFDLFERLNTGGLVLTAQEVRECVYRGEFMDFVGECAQSSPFKDVLHLPEARWKDGTPEDFVIRFFAFLDKYEEFDHSVKDFLNDFCAEAVKSPSIARRRAIFSKTFEYLVKSFPGGIKTRKGQTPVNLFEAISVGAALALDKSHELAVSEKLDWIESENLKKLTTGATNSRSRVRGRIEFCRDRFIGLPMNV